MLDKKNLDTLIENKEFNKINMLLINEFKELFKKLTNTKHLDLSLMNLILLMKKKYPYVSERLDFLNYILSKEDEKTQEKVYNLLNLYLNFAKFNFN